MADKVLGVNMKGRFNLVPLIIIGAIIAIIIFCIITVRFDVMSVDVFPSNFIGATLGALIGALITVLLLIAQTAVEEKKGRNIKILEKKTEIFKGFIKDVWDLWKEQNITIEKIRNLTSTYTDLIIYIKDERRLKIIGKCLTNIGKSVIENNDRVAVRKNIIAIINELSQELELGGKIDEEIENILQNHENLVSDLKQSFQKILLNTLNKYLPTDDILEEGKYENFKEGPYNLQYACFNFKQFKGCKIIIGPTIGGNHLQFVLIVDLQYENVNGFRPKAGTYRQRIELSGVADLRNPVNNIGNSLNLPIIDFEKEENMEFYLKNSTELSNVIAERAKYYFYLENTVKNLRITDFLNEYIKKE